MNRLLQLCFWGAAGFALVMALLPQPPRVPGDPSDKVQHMLAFFVIALLGALAFPRLSLVRLAVALALFGAFIEIVQLVPALNRTGEVLDWVADMVAVAVALGLVALVRRTRASS